MIPLCDVIPSRTTPWITVTLLGINGAAFLAGLALTASGYPHAAATYGLVPGQFTWLAVVTSMFLNAGWMHAASNMLALWIFGQSVEDRMGHGRFLLFCGLAGAAGMLAGAWADPSSARPLTGASGIAAGAVGAHLLLFPRTRILALLPLFRSFDIVEVPALAVIGFWFVFQLLGDGGAIASGTATGHVWIILGGAAAGVAGAWILRRPDRLRVEWWSPRR